MDSVALGRFVLPAMEKLSERLPHLCCASLCTADGFNVCSIGITEQQLGKMAALSGSLLTLGEAMLNNLSASTPGPVLDIMTLEAGTWIIVAVRVAAPGQPLVLTLSATQTPLGVLHLRARQTAEEISSLLGYTSPAKPPQTQGDILS